MISIVEYRVGQELPELSLEWLASDGTVAPLATGWTPSVRFALSDQPNDVIDAATVTSGITLADTSPNFVIAWSTTVWSDLVTAAGVTLPPGNSWFDGGTWFDLWPHLMRTGDSKDRPWPGRPIRLRLRPAAT